MDRLNIAWEKDGGAGESTDGEGLTFERAKALADAAADTLLGGGMLLSFYDRDRNLEAPKGVSECHDGDHCSTPGWLAYAEHREGRLMVDFEAGRFVFCYRDAEF